MKSSPDEVRDPLHEALSTHVEDDGFTDRLMARLPPPQTRVRRVPILLGAAALGSLVAFASPAGTFLYRLFGQVEAGEHSFTAAIVLVCMMVAMIGASLSTAYAE